MIDETHKNTIDEGIMVTFEEHIDWSEWADDLHWVASARDYGRLLWCWAKGGIDASSKSADEAGQRIEITPHGGGFIAFAIKSNSIDCPIQTGSLQLRNR